MTLELPLLLLFCCIKIWQFEIQNFKNYFILSTIYFIWSSGDPLLSICYFKVGFSISSKLFYGYPVNSWFFLTFRHFSFYWGLFWIYFYFNDTDDKNVFAGAGTKHVRLELNNNCVFDCFIDHSPFLVTYAHIF